MPDPFTREERNLMNYMGVIRYRVTEAQNGE